MAITDTLAGSAIPFGAEPIPAGQGLFGSIDAVRQQETVSPGMAVVHRLSTDATTYRDAFKFGNASGRGEFWGVVSTKGGSPTMDIVAFAGNGQGISVLFLGYAPVLVGPGQTVRRGMFLEPIASGTGQAMFRPVLAGGRGVVQALADCDNSAGTSGAWVSGYVNAAGFGTGLVFRQLVDSNTLTNSAAETVFNQFPTLPARSITLDSVYRLRAKVRVPSGNAADTLILRARLGGVAGALLSTSPTVDVTDGGGDIGVVDLVVSFRAPLGAVTPVQAAGFTGLGVPITATSRITGTLATAPTVDVTAAAGLDLVITGQWSGANAGNQAIMEEYVVEQLA